MTGQSEYIKQLEDRNAELEKIIFDLDRKNQIINLENTKVCQMVEDYNDSHSSWDQLSVTYLKQVYEIISNEDFQYVRLNIVGNTFVTFFVFLGMMASIILTFINIPNVIASVICGIVASLLFLLFLNLYSELTSRLMCKRILNIWDRNNERL